MANSLTSILASTNSNGEVSSLEFEGTTDNSCSNLRIEVYDQGSGDLLLTAPVVINGNRWNKSFLSPADFSIHDFQCNSNLDIILKCRDTNPSVILLSDSGKIICSDSACTITIDEVIGVPDSSSSLQSLEITGTSSCSTVNVTAQIGSVSIDRSNINVDNNGNWRTVFVAGDPETRSSLKEFKCKDIINITVICANDKTCNLNIQREIICDEKKTCPLRADVRLTGPNNFNKLNPTDSELECLQPGDYTITCSTVANSYIWSSNDVTVSGRDLSRNVLSVNGNTMSIRYGSNNLNSHFSVIAVKDVACLPISTVAFHCGVPLPPDEEPTPPSPPPSNEDNTPTPDEDSNDQSSGCDLCCIWFLVNMALVFLTLVLFTIAGCIFQFIDPISLTIAIIAAILTTASFIAWAIVCRSRSGNSCIPLLRWLDILDVLTVLAGVVALAVGLNSPCAIAFWINAGFLQWIRRILQSFSVLFGCSPNPWWRS